MIMVTSVIVMTIIEGTLVYSGSIKMDTEWVWLGAIEHIGGDIRLVERGGNRWNERGLDIGFSREAVVGIASTMNGLSHALLFNQLIVKHAHK